MIVVIAFFGLFFLWSILAPVETAAISPGKIVSSTNRKTIQHLEGGIIKKIYVQEGSTVKAGDPLIKLDDTQAKATYDLLHSQANELLATEARLSAERDNQATIQFPEILLKQQNDIKTKKIMGAQETIFQNNKKTLSDQLNILAQRITEYEKQIEGHQAQVISNEKQLEFVQKELDALNILDKKHYIEKPRLWSVEREAARLRGNRGELEASIAETQQKIGETKQQMISLKNTTQKDILDKYAETQRNLLDTLEREKATEDTLRRTLVTAPQDGVIVNLQEHTIGGVIGPGKAILDLVPTHDALVVEARVSPLDIDIVHPGLDAKVKLTAYKQRSTPAIDGIVTEVSADSFQDPQTNSSYYVARIIISNEQLKKLPKIKLYPGMPVEVMIIVDNRTAWEYFVTPIKESYSRAFREQ
ncbi:MAG: hypothetical protein A3E84_02520 [Gammaproteobacteria bacterium RIFCSPHIGHO2_12_FULL_42_13]|nr:MAG: hypothetical protein A3E84_02520 [Gammaproteobacteria bacterium RIFCSPHIGHO2_12_FULL_42_13]